MVLEIFLIILLIYLNLVDDFGLKIHLGKFFMQGCFHNLFNAGEYL